MKRVVMRSLFVVLAMVAMAGAARAEDPFTLAGSASRINIGENQAWTAWYAVNPGKQAEIRFTAPGQATFRIRKLLSASDPKWNQAVPVVIRFGSTVEKVTVEGAQAKAIVHKSQYKVGEPTTVTRTVAAGEAWRIAGPDGAAPVAFLVDVQPLTESTPAVAAAEAPETEAPADEEGEEEDEGTGTSGPATRFFAGADVGYLYGIGDVRSPNAEVKFGYRTPWLNNALAFSATGGWYATSEIEQKRDVLIGAYENEWHLTAIPISLNAEYWLPLPSMIVYGGLGFEYVSASFTFESRSDLGVIDPLDTTSGNAFGTRFFGGVRRTMGPGDLVGTLKYSTTNISNDFSELTGDLGGFSLLVGYAFNF